MHVFIIMWGQRPHMEARGTCGTCVHDSAGRPLMQVADDAWAALHLVEASLDAQ